MSLKLLMTAAVATAAFLVPAGTASASLLATTSDCPVRPITQPFSAWGDLSDYVLVPDGDLSNGVGGWVLGSGSSIADGVLQVGDGATATTATMCIGQEHPTIRFMARNIGNSSSKLWVQAAIETAKGKELSIPIGFERGNAMWEPSTSMKLWVNFLNMSPGTYTPVEFSFTSRGGAWLVDDVYVDPRRN